MNFSYFRCLDSSFLQSLNLQPQSDFTAERKDSLVVFLKCLLLKKIIFNDFWQYCQSSFNFSVLWCHLMLNVSVTSVFRYQPMNIILHLRITLPTKLPLIVSKCPSVSKSSETIVIVSMTFNCFFPKHRDHCKFNNSVNPTEFLVNIQKIYTTWCNLFMDVAVKYPETWGTLELKLLLH